MEQNRNPSLSASALSSRMESARGDVPPRQLEHGQGGAAQLRSGPRVPSMPGGLPPLPTFKALPQWDCRNVFSPPRSDTYTSMPPQRAEESFSSLMGQAAGSQPQSLFQRGFPASMGWDMPHEHAGVPRMQQSRSFDDSITVGRVHTGVAGEDGRAAMQTSNMEVGLHGRRCKEGPLAGEVPPPLPHRLIEWISHRRQSKMGTVSGPFPNAGAQDACSGPVEDIAGTQAAQGMATADMGETREGSKNRATASMPVMESLPQKERAGAIIGGWMKGLALLRYLEEEDAMHVNRPRSQQDSGVASDDEGGGASEGIVPCRPAEGDMSEGSMYRAHRQGGRRSRSDSPAAGGRDETMSDIATTSGDSNKQNVELVGTFVTVLEGLKKTMADGNAALR
ncbi:hypothetical protein CBR_g45592 [Chara braunii]|uniref:Uncharacterized protein n=1 Tax=Chara braunii TaxID=69332 RepID=A0A388LYY3_CHABU|nr:hypothetical protein CBR_g45592 [Chara braunii]|eukprot:GBG87534.1 hypothetical protein CBR_g45592 [Chara braunii]